jgi:hypothetical protein
MRNLILPIAAFLIAAMFLASAATPANAVVAEPRTV